MPLAMSEYSPIRVHPALGSDERPDGCLLGFQAEAAMALLGGRDAIQGDRVAATG